MVVIGWKGRGFYTSNFLIQNLKIYAKGVMKKNTSTVFLVDGRSGLGKTTLSAQVGCILAKMIASWKDKYEPLPNKEKHEPKFSLDDMCWTPKEFLEKLKNAKRGDIIIMDESMIFSNRSALSEYNRAVIIMMSMIRSKQIFVMFNVNSIFDLDRNLPLHRADMLIHLYAHDDKFASRGRYFVVPSSKGRLKRLFIMGKKYYDYSRAKSAFRDHFTSFFPFSEKEYENKKQKAIQGYFGKKEDKKHPNYARVRNKLLLHLIYKMKKIKNISYVEQAELGGCSLRMMTGLVQEYKDTYGEEKKLTDKPISK